MSKWTLDFETGEYVNIERDGFNIDRGEYTYNWDDSEYRREEESFGILDDDNGMIGLIDDDDDDMFGFNGDNDDDIIGLVGVDDDDNW